MPDLAKTLAYLHRVEIQTGHRAVARGRFRFWIGGDEERPRAAKDFSVEELDQVATWLRETAIDLHGGRLQAAEKKS